MNGPEQPRLLVTGAAGTLARKVILQLKDSCNVVAVDFREQLQFGDGVSAYCLDISQPGFDDFFRQYRFDGILHLGRAMNRPDYGPDRFRAHAQGTRKLMDLCLAHNVSRMVVLSTHLVYGPSPTNPVPIDETTPPKLSALPAALMELESLFSTYLWRYPHLDLTVLRPCHIIGPGVRNTMSTLLSGPWSPVLAGFSPMMQFIHIDDMADAVIRCWSEPHRGIYNVAPDDWVAYQRAVVLSGSNRLPLPSLPPVLPQAVLKLLNMRHFPPYLMDVLRYPIIINGQRFAQDFGFHPRQPLGEIFRFYRKSRRRGFHEPVSY